jgi:hypothetical protein
MRKYCKAYHLADLRRFDGWIEQNANDDSVMEDDTICYIWDDFTVVSSPIKTAAPIFDQITPEWKQFCIDQLHFSIPEDLHYAYEQFDQEEEINQAGSHATP